MTETAQQSPAETAANILVPVAKQLATGALTSAFNRAARHFIEGELKVQSQDAVEKMHQRFNQRIQATVDAALKDCTDEDLKKAATAYCIALSRDRKEITPKQLKEKAEKGTAALQEETKTILTSLTELETSLKGKLGEKRVGAIEIASGSAAPDAPEASADSANAPAAKPNLINKVVDGFMNIFGDRSKPKEAVNDDAPSPVVAETPAPVTPEPQPAPAPEPAPEPETPEQTMMRELLEGTRTRVYFKLSDYSSSPVQPFVEEYLKPRGFTVTDYQGGYATDARKNTHKIGKLLKDNAGLLEAFREDSFRMSKELMVVITRDYEDLARASYGRGWQSCRANAYSAVDYAVKEIDIGVMAAYLIRPDDPDIHDPLGRINVKPYDNTQNNYWSSERKKPTKTVFLAFNPIGLHHPGFVDAVNHFADDNLNGPKFGKFYLRSGCESYREFEERWRIPMDAEGALKALDIKFTKDAEGKITVPGDLILSNMGLNRLPDLQDVVVKGNIDVSKNKLLTLEGLPQAPAKSLNVSSNLLVCFTGAPPVVKGEFNYKDCAYLTTTLGAPEADKYSYGNGHRDTNRYKTSKECVGPVEDPERFPSFKRKD